MSISFVLLLSRNAVTRIVFFFPCMIESEQFSALFEAFFSFLKTEWELQSAVVSGNEVG